MNKFLKIALIILGGIVLFVAGFVGFIATSGPVTYPPGNLSISVSMDSASIANGQRLTNMLCTHCHKDHQTNRLTGHVIQEAPELGKIYSPNITQHPEKGIGKWTDGELKYFLRTGVKPNGEFAYPPMVAMPNISDEDLDDVIAFLRSDNSLVAASEVEAPPMQPSLLLKGLARFVLKPMPYPESEIVSPETNDLLAYGEYLVNDQLFCYACHSENFQTNDDVNPANSVGYLGGGNPMFTDDGLPVSTANITMDVATGIGKWTKEEFKTAMRMGKRPNGKMISTPMIPYPNLTDKELDAIYAYLQSVPKIENAVVQAD